MSNIISTTLFCSSYLWITFPVVHRTTGKVIFCTQLPSWSWDTSLAIIIIPALAIKLIIYWVISLFEVLEWFYYNTACTLSRFSHVRLFATLWTVSPPSSSVQGILQARILEWVAMPYSRGPSWPRDQTHISLHLLHWQAGSLPLAPLGKPPRWYARLQKRLGRHLCELDNVLLCKVQCLGWLSFKLKLDHCYS